MKDFFTISSDEDTETITVFTYSSDEDEDKFKPIEVKPLKELSGFNVVKHEQYGTTSIYVVDEEKKTKPWEKYCTIDEQTAKVRLQSPSLICDFKMWKTLTNGALELLGFPHVTFVRGNMMYPKTKLTQPSIPQPKKFILKSMFINTEGKAFPQLWLE